MIFLPKGLPAKEIIEREGYSCGDFILNEAMLCPAEKKVLYLNLMPEKAYAELDTCRVLAFEDLSLQMIPIKISGQTYKNTPQAHMDAFYLDFEKVENGYFDGIIINGTPLEHLAFEEVRYWEKLCHIMDWADTHCKSSLYVCWGAQAALYHFYAIPKYFLPAKMFGIYPQKVLLPDSPLMKHLSPFFPMPTSRHTEERSSDFCGKSVKLVAEGEESGVGVAIDEIHRRVFIVGHLEYAKETLQREYLRDKAKGLDIAPPKYYYENDDDTCPILFNWHETARRFYRNWLDFCESSVI